jgi:hypothetical protein
MVREQDTPRNPVPRRSVVGWLVPNEESPEHHHVVNDAATHCSCPHFAAHGDCGHLNLVHAAKRAEREAAAAIVKAIFG